MNISKFSTILGYTGPEFEFGKIANASNLVEPGDIYLATDYSAFGVANRHNFISDAIERGATAVIVSQPEIAASSASPRNDALENRVIVIRVADTNAIEARLYQEYYDNPQEELTMIGVTGTDGKGTTSQIIKTLVGETCAYIGTAGSYFKDLVLPKTNTTPAPQYLYKILREFLDNGCKQVALEVGAEGIYHNRVNDLKFDIIGYTNWTDPYLDMKSQPKLSREMKLSLSKNNLKTGTTVFVNSSIEFAGEIPEAKTYGLKDTDNLQILETKLYPTSTDATLLDNATGEKINVTIPLFGAYNVENYALAYLIANQIGVDQGKILENTKDISIMGNLSTINKPGFPTIIYDNADTENSFRKSLINIKETYPNSKLIMVYGPNGGRSTNKYEVNAKVINEFVDFVTLTYYSPKNDDPQYLAEYMAKFIDPKKYKIELNRKQAIQDAILSTNENDVVIVETIDVTTKHYDHGKIIHIDDKAIVEELLGINKIN
jgi:UDP-N-acetylmuramoyl-L-alanyl-D-glutamate--2,6-diaminopimelate ligase